MEAAPMLARFHSHRTRLASGEAAAVPLSSDMKVRRFTA
jgi:hypothetical protein